MEEIESININYPIDEPKSTVIYGAWNFSEVAAEILELNEYQVNGFIDPSPPNGIKTLNHYPNDVTAFIAIGDNTLREYVTHTLQSNHRNLVSAIHPSAIISSSAFLGNASLLGEYSVIRTGSTVLEGLSLQTGAVISHHCKIGKFVSVGPNAAIASRVKIGNRTLVGTGAVIKPGVCIGNDCIIGAGAVVFKDLPSYTTVVGNPARTIPQVSLHKKDRQSDWHNNHIW